MSASTRVHSYWTPRAWLGRGWGRDVRLQVDLASGHWLSIETGVDPTSDDERLGAPVMPSLVNAHSHAFQRAFVGLAERRESGADDFWSWRDRMYQVALSMSPAQLLHVAIKLYRELLVGGYTHVCEFHYLHHDVDGQAYAAPSTMALTLVEAARQVGIGITLLPVVYERAGFEQPTLRHDQRRFAASLDFALRVRDDVRAVSAPNVGAGLALHSLRAVAPETLARLRDAIAADPAPIHIHVAEQTAEVDDCLRTTGRRPIEWLAEHAGLDARWQLVHATHATHAEIQAVADQRAGVVLCPSTEANLGDGFTDVPAWLASETPCAIGSDSHVTRSWPEELRWLEYGQRLLRRQRNVGAAPDQGYASTAARLLDRCVDGGAAAAGHASWGLRVGARADLLLLNTEDSALADVDGEHLLDALVFGSPSRPFQRVMVAGRWVTPR